MTAALPAGTRYWTGQARVHLPAFAITDDGRIITSEGAAVSGGQLVAAREWVVPPAGTYRPDVWAHEDSVYIDRQPVLAIDLAEGEAAYLDGDGWVMTDDRFITADMDATTAHNVLITATADALRQTHDDQARATLAAFRAHLEATRPTPEAAWSM